MALAAYGKNSHKTTFYLCPNNHNEAPSEQDMCKESEPNTAPDTQLTR